MAIYGQNTVSDLRGPVAPTNPVTGAPITTPHPSGPIIRGPVAPFGPDLTLPKDSAGKQIIAATGARLVIIATDSGGTAVSDLTTTTFDTTTRADSAEVLITNSTGATRLLTSVSIIGKPIFRYSGTRGFVHDAFKDDDAIARDGEVDLTVSGNNYVCTKALVEQLADWLWKFNRNKKHLYSLTLSGRYLWYEPGEWYTLQIGGAGQKEYIDSTVRCIAVDISQQARDIGTTQVTFEEVEEAWKKDSNAAARLIASGNTLSSPAWSNRAKVDTRTGAVTVNKILGPPNSYLGSVLATDDRSTLDTIGNMTPSTVRDSRTSTLGNSTPDRIGFAISGDIRGDNHTIWDMSLHGHDANNREYIFGNSGGAKITDPNGQIVHDVPDVPLEFSAYPMGHLYLQAYQTLLVATTSASIRSWVSVTAEVFSLSNVKASG